MSKCAEPKPEITGWRITEIQLGDSDGPRRDGSALTVLPCRDWAVIVWTGIPAGMDLLSGG